MAEARAAYEILEAAVGPHRSLFGRSIGSAQALFAAVDGDGSRALSLEELGEALQRLGLRLTDAQLLELFAAADADCTGTIEWEEFAHGLHSAHYSRKHARQPAKSKSRPPKLEWRLEGHSRARRCVRCGSRARYYCPLCCNDAAGALDLDSACWYCGYECQGIHWAVSHRDQCRGAKAARAESNRRQTASRNKRARKARLQAAVGGSAWATAFCVHRTSAPLGPVGLNRNAASRPSASAAAACGRRGWSRWYRAGREISKLEWDEPCHPIHDDQESRGHGLLWAAASGLPQIVERLLAQRADPCAARDRLGRTALMLAAARGELEVVQELIARPSPRTWDTSRVCRWLQVVQRCNDSVLKRVTAAQLNGESLLCTDPPTWIKLGARPRQAVQLTNACVMLMNERYDAEQLQQLLHCVDRDGASALHYAAVCPSPAIVSLLLKTDSSIAAVTDSDGFSALVAAAVAPEPGAAEIVELMLSTEEDFLAKADTEALAEDQEAFEVWLQRFEFGSVWRNGLLAMSALHAAVLAQNAEVVRALCAHTATLGLLSLADCTGTTALGYAVALANGDVLNALLENGAVVADAAAATELSCRESSNGNVGNPPALLLAAAAGSTRVVRQMCSHDQGCSACDADSTGRCALQWAVAGRHVDTVTTLLKHGAKVTQLAEDGSSALTWLVMSSEHTSTGCEFSTSAASDKMVGDDDKKDEDPTIREMVEFHLAPALLNEIGDEMLHVQTWLAMHLWLDVEVAAWICEPLELEISASNESSGVDKQCGFCQRLALVLSNSSVEHGSATLMQSIWRGRAHRRRASRKRASVCFIQAFWRDYCKRLKSMDVGRTTTMAIADVAAAIVQKPTLVPENSMSAALGSSPVCDTAYGHGGETASLSKTLLHAKEGESDTILHTKAHGRATEVLSTLLLWKVHAARARDHTIGARVRLATWADAATVLTTLCRRRLAYRLAAKLAVKREAEYRARFRADPVRWCTSWADELARDDLWSFESVCDDSCSPSNDADDDAVISNGTTENVENIDDESKLKQDDTEEQEQEPMWGSISSDGCRLLSLGAISSTAASFDGSTREQDGGFGDSEEDSDAGQWGSSSWVPEVGRDPEFVPPPGCIPPSVPPDRRVNRDQVNDDLVSGQPIDALLSMAGHLVAEERVRSPETRMLSRGFTSNHDAEEQQSLGLSAWGQTVLNPDKS